MILIILCKSKWNLKFIAWTESNEYCVLKIALCVHFLLIGCETELNQIDHKCSNQIFQIILSLSWNSWIPTISLCILRHKHPYHVIEDNFFININQVSLISFCVSNTDIILQKPKKNRLEVQQFWKLLKVVGKDINCSKSLYMHIIIYVGKSKNNKQKKLLKEQKLASKGQMYGLKEHLYSYHIDIKIEKV